ncbi:MAG: 5-formyltetrahydrofolate cyclo-ligase [Pseudomonadota bacterium]
MPTAAERAPDQAKSALRAELARLRRALDPSTTRAWDQAIGRHLLAWWEDLGLDTLAVYWPLKGEPDLAAAYAELVRRGARLALPVVLARDAPLAFAHWEPGEAMGRDCMGVAVPAAMRPLARPPAILVPCLGFNGARLRLGYGGGYYDRTLAPAPRALAAGVAYACQAAQFDGAAHDVALDLIVTETGLR